MACSYPDKHIICACGEPLSCAGLVSHRPNPCFLERWMLLACATLLTVKHSGAS